MELAGDGLAVHDHDFHILAIGVLIPCHLEFFFLGSEALNDFLHGNPLRRRRVQRPLLRGSRQIR